MYYSYLNIYHSAFQYFTPLENPRNVRNKIILKCSVCTRNLNFTRLSSPLSVFKAHARRMQSVHRASRRGKMQSKECELGAGDQADKLVADAARVGNKL